MTRTRFLEVRTARYLASVFGATMLGLALGASAAVAWTPENLDCNVPYDDYRLVDWGDEQPPSGVGWSNLTFTDWSTGAEGNFDDGADNWEAVDRPDDTNVVNISKVSSGGIPFWHVDLNQAGAAGAVVCNGGQLYGAVDFTEFGGTPLGNDHQKGLATHEIGHALGIHHVGTDDNQWTSAEPTMVGGSTQSYSALATVTPVPVAVESGELQIRLIVRRLEANGTDPSGVFDYLDTPTSNPDINDAAYSGSWVVAEEHIILTPPTSWAERETLSYTIPHYWEGAAVRIRIKNTFEDSAGNSVSVDIDNARIQEQP